jgi:GT2 family glycosyltransferase
VTPRTTTVAIPVLNGGAGLADVLTALRAQRLEGDLEVLVCDSGSTDGSAELARGHGATVIEIEPTQFSHGGTRNLLMQRAAGDHVAFLTQDALPTDERWLSRLLDGFELAGDVGLVFGPYVPRPDASPMVARELTHWFAAFAPDGRPRVDRLDEGERDLPARELLGPRGFFTDANGCISRDAWQHVPFRAIPYAEDHALAHDMLRAGYAKVCIPDAAVVHSHDYSELEWLRRTFDETRALHDLYGYVEPANLRTTSLKLWGLVGADWRWAGATGRRSLVLLPKSVLHHGARIAGAVLGTRASHLPVGMVTRLSLERRR